MTSLSLERGAFASASIRQNHWGKAQALFSVTGTFMELLSRHSRGQLPRSEQAVNDKDSAQRPGRLARPRVDLGRAGALEPTRSPFQARACPCEWAKWSTGVGPGSDARQSLLEQVDPLKAPKEHMLPGKPMGQDLGFPVATTCRPVSWTSHTAGLTVLPCPLWGSQEQPFAPTAPLQTRLSRETK